jgi:SNF2 family DNA or RNA helicase
MGKKLIEDKIKDICVFASSDNIELPPKIEKKIYFEFSPKKKEKFKNFTRDYIMLLQDEATKNEKEITVLSKQILINKCLQLANGCIYHNKLGDYTVFDNTKLNYVKAYSEKYPEKNILVFYPFRFDKKRLLTLPGAVAIDSVKSKNDWNDGKIKLGIISPSSFQYGGNLQFGGYTLLWFGLVWGLENVLQSNKRLWRQGQTHPVEILYLMMRGTWDDYVYKTVVTKEVNQNDFLSRINIKNLT